MAMKKIPGRDSKYAVREQVKTINNKQRKRRYLYIDCTKEDFSWLVLGMGAALTSIHPSLAPIAVTNTAVMGAMYAIHKKANGNISIYIKGGFYTVPGVGSLDAHIQVGTSGPVFKEWHPEPLFSSIINKLPLT